MLYDVFAQRFMFVFSGTQGGGWIVSAISANRQQEVADDSNVAAVLLERGVIGGPSYLIGACGHCVEKRSNSKHCNVVRVPVADMCSFRFIVFVYRRRRYAAAKGNWSVAFPSRLIRQRYFQFRRSTRSDIDVRQ